jgi:type 2 lantibiotic biosynthesis protein LanM
MLDEPDIINVAERALTPLEQFSLGGCSSAADERETARRVLAWAEALGGQQALERRLRELNQATPEALCSLAVPAASIRGLPWVGDFNRFYHRVAWTAPPMADVYAVPFAAIINAWVEAVSRPLRDESLSCSELNDLTWTSLKQALANDLSTILAPALQTEYHLFSLHEMPGLDHASSQRMAAFYRAQMSDGMATFFHRFPMALRHVASAGARWLATSESFASRLREDAQELQERWPFCQWDRLKAVSLGLSDAHDGGKTVVEMVFDEGSVFYKPKPLHSEAFFGNYLEFLTATGCAEAGSLVAVDLIVRDDYGWARGVRRHRFENEGDLVTYFENAGALLGGLYVAGGTDVHVENLIACATAPVMIDAETLFHPPVSVNGQDSAALAVNRELFTESIIRTGLLPWWKLSASGQPLDVGGLTGGAQPLQFHERAWINANRDRQRLTRRAVKKQLNIGNLPLFEGRPVSAARYVDAVTRGFAHFMSGVCAQKSGVRAWLELNVDRELPLRFIFRSTAIYLRTLQSLQEPSALKSGFSTFLVLERLSRARYCDAASDYPSRELLDAEVSQLLARDVPIFLMNARSSDLKAPLTDTLPGFFECTGLDFALSRLQGLDAAQINLQTNLLKTSFALASGQHAVNATPASMGREEENIARRELSHLDAAEGIAQRLEESAFFAEDSSVNWISVIYEDRLQRWQVQPLGARLFDGISGLVMFFAAACDIKEHPRHRGLLDRSVATLEGVVAHPSFAREAGRLGLGIATGLSSIADTLGRLSRHQRYTHLSSSTEACLSLLVRLVNASGDAVNRDLFGGAAGALAALASSPPGLLDSIALKGLRADLFAYLESPQWRELPVGYAHGRSGILWALACSHRAVPLEPFERELLRVEQERIADEFLPQHGNWLDPRYPNAGDGAGVTWTFCGGAPGIVHGAAPVIATVGSGPLKNRWAQIRESVIASHRRAPANPVDHLCCGNFGRMLALNDPPGNSPVATVPTGTYSLGWEGIPDVPGLFQGLAGIGLAHLYLHDRARAQNWMWWSADVPID